MALRFIDTNLIGPDVAIDLRNEDDLFVSRLVKIVSTIDRTVVFAAGSGRKLTVNGTIDANSVAGTNTKTAVNIIAIDDLKDSGTTIDVGLEGSILTAKTGVAVIVETNGTFIENDGLISGGIGIVVGGQNTTTSNVVNNGTIVGEVAGISSNQESNEKLVIVNNGRIEGKLAALIFEAELDANLQNTVQDVTNTGSIIGHVILGAGDDRYDGRLGTIDGNVVGGDGKDVLLGGAGNETFFGGVGIDRLLGGGGNDRLEGGADNDRLEGGEGKDTLKGDVGNDFLFGGKSADRLVGGAGDDLFVFTSVTDSTVSVSGRDTIFDFQNGDRINLKTIDANTRASGNQKFTFIGADAFSKAAGELSVTIDKGKTFIKGDVNGDGKADFAIVLKGSIELDGSDFVL